MPDEIGASLGGELPVRGEAARATVDFCGFNPVRLEARTRLRHRLSATPGLRGVACRLGLRIAEFHERLPPGEFEERQRACRRLWSEWLSPYNFFKNLRRYFG